MEYKRLTAHKVTSFYDWERKNLNPELAAEIYDRLAELEDKIEQGTLIELKKGKWLHSEKAFTSYFCSECGGEPMYSPDKKGKAYITITQFCPTCGAKMDFTEEDEEVEEQE